MTVPRRSTAELLAAMARITLAHSSAAGRPTASITAAAATTSAARHSSSSSSSFASSSRHFATSTPAELATPVADAAASSASAAAEPASSSSSATPAASTIPAREWTPTSRRVGLLARKRGMLTYFLPTGQAVPCTVLQVDSNQISAQIGFEPATAPATHDEKGSPVRVPKVAPYLALQVAASNAMSGTGVNRSRKGHLAKAGIVAPKKILKEFKISADAVLPLGTRLSAAHFVPGQAVDVSATSRGRGFAGAMKRHGFHGLRASHGVSISHRSHGSTGQHQDPGRVFPGKKMAGRMGNKRATVHNLRVLRVDLDRQLVLVQGNVPGADGGMVEVTDARRDLMWKAMTKQRKQGITGAAALPEGISALPFPAATKEFERGLPRVVEWNGGVEEVKGEETA